jgi:hypothetical protein
MQYSQLIPGDVLLRWKEGVWHLGIYMGNGTVLHNSPGVGERVTSYAEYANGKQVKAWQPDSVKRAEIMQRAWQIIQNPQDYKHLTRNCEHTIYEAIEGKAKSPTITGILWVIGIGTAIYVTARYGKQIAKALKSTK